MLTLSLLALLGTIGGSSALGGLCDLRAEASYPRPAYAGEKNRSCGIGLELYFFLAPNPHWFCVFEICREKSLHILQGQCHEM
jgi:hypothetical protein